VTFILANGRALNFSPVPIPAPVAGLRQELHARPRLYGVSV